MIRTPAHKQTDPDKKPGQIKTLGDYVSQVQISENPKLTFEQWVKQRFEGLNMYTDICFLDLEECWKAAQENK